MHFKIKKKILSLNFQKYKINTKAHLKLFLKKKFKLKSMQVHIETHPINDFLTNTTVKLNLIHNILSIQIPEVRFDLFQKIDSVKV